MPCTRPSSLPRLVTAMLSNLAGLCITLYPFVVEYFAGWGRHAF
jgi:hypothetical protein